MSLYYWFIGRHISNFIFRIEERIKEVRGCYHIKSIDYYKTLWKYGEIVTKKRRMLDEKKVRKLMKAMDNFNNIVNELH